MGEEQEAPPGQAPIVQRTLPPQLQQTRDCGWGTVGGHPEDVSQARDIVSQPRDAMDLAPHTIDTPSPWTSVTKNDELPLLHLKKQ